MNSQIIPELSDVLDIVPGPVPVFTDECNHGTDHYVGTIQVLRNHEDYKKTGGIFDCYDVYIFHSENYQEVCLRYGNEPHEYISPGTLIDFIRAASNKMPHYYKAMQLILSRGKIRWEAI